MQFNSYQSSRKPFATVGKWSNRTQSLDFTMHKLIIREAAQSDAAAIHTIHIASISVLCATTYTSVEINA